MPARKPVPIPHGYRTSAFWYALGARISVTAPRDRILAAARGLGDWYQWTHPGTRRIVARQLAAADAARNDDRRTSTSRPFREFAETVADFLRLAGGRGGEILDEIEVDGVEYLDRCRLSGRGTIFLSAHLGNWEAVAAWGARAGLPVKAVVWPHPHPGVDEFFTAAQARLRGRRDPAGRRPASADRAPARGGFVAVLGDRDFSGRGRRVPFLGGIARLPAGWARLAVATGSWILPGRHLRRDTDGRRVSRLVLEEPWPSDGVAPTELFERGRAFLESLIAEDPGAWTVFDPVLEPAAAR